MSLSIVQTANGGQTASQATVVISSMNVTAGNLLVVVANTTDANFPTAVTDTNGNVYTPVTAVVNGTASPALQFWYAPNINGGANNVITVTYNAASTYRAAFAWEVAGADKSFPFDASSGISTTSAVTTGVSVAFTTTNANDIILAAVATNNVNSTFSAGGSYHLDSAGYPPTSALLFCGAESLVVSSIQTAQTASVSWNTAASGYGMAVAAFKAASVSSISGSAGVARATVTYTGTASGTVTADGSGNYTIPAANGAYTITPSLTGYTFSPTNSAQTVSGADITGVNFTATQTLVATPTFLPVAGSYSSTQNVTISSTDSGLSGFTVTYTTDGTTPVPGSHGIVYSTPVVVASSLTLKAVASATGYANSAEADAAYTIALAIYSISGSAGVASATVSYSGTASGSVTADGSGNYSITGLANGSYTVTPTKTGYTFSPTSQNVTISGSSQTGTNFTAAAGGSHYSVPDCRLVPNTGVTVQGTIQYTGQTSDNAAIPPVDSRATEPTACGTYPQNSRAPGTFGPNE